MKYKPGDVVELNSGSPPLTVTQIVPDRYGPGHKVEVWWILEGQAHNEQFPEACLKPYDEPLNEKS